MRVRFRHVAAGFALLAAGAYSASAQEIYRWTDANGTVHYGQIAPHGVPYETVNSMGRGPSPPPSIYNPYQRRDPPATATSPAGSVGAVADSGGSALTPEQLARQSELEAEAQARLAEISASRAQNCELAHEQFRQFTTYARIRVADGAGGVRILSDDERAARIAEAQEAIVLNCDEAG